MAECGECEKRDRCTQPCDEVNSLLWTGNRVMERQHQADRIVCYPRGKEVHFSELENLDIEDLSDIFPWSSADCRLTKTAVFVERFFNKTPCRELAERFGVKENTIVCMYAQAVEQLERIIGILDARREGIKAMKPGKFTEDQKFFLLVAVFGFSQAEVARMFRKHKDVVNHKVKRLSDRYGAAFAGESAG